MVLVHDESVRDTELDQPYLSVDLKYSLPEHAGSEADIPPIDIIEETYFFVASHEQKGRAPDLPPTPFFLGFWDQAVGMEYQPVPPSLQ
jgi:hypothetical protein